MKSLPLMIAGVIFTIVALMHLLRVIYHWQVMIAGYDIPLSVSILAFVIAVTLALWMFIAAAKN